MMKKEVCRYWVRNNCTKGSNCNFLHEFQQDKMPNCTVPNCNNNMCFFKHEMKKTLCSNYENGFCSFGNTCPHLHVPKEGPPPLIAPLFTYQDASIEYQKEMQKRIRIKRNHVHIGYETVGVLISKCVILLIKMKFNHSR
jgi:hypothetical protein